MQFRNHSFVIKSTYISSFGKLERLFLYFMCCFQAVIMFKSDKSLLPLRKKKIYSQFASEWKFCSLIVTGVPIRLKRFIGQSLCLSKLLWALVRDKFRRQSIIIRVALHFEHRSLKSCFKLCLECSSPSSP